jgi:AcrR family transcriptional regulator
VALAVPVSGFAASNAAPARPGDPAADRILDAADRLLGRFGYRKMTIDDLAREAGIGKGSVYLSFRSKADVALACIDRMAGRLLVRLEAIAAGRAAPAVRLRAMLVTRVLHRFDYARGHSDRLDELLAAIRPRLLERRSVHFRAEARIVARVLGEAGVARPGETAEAMILAGNALLPYSLGARELGRRSELARRARRVADLVLVGALPRKSVGASPRKSGGALPRRSPRSTHRRPS